MYNSDIAQNVSSQKDTLNPFDLDALRLPDGGLQKLTTKKLLTTIPVRKPAKEWFFRTHPDYQFDTLLLVMKEEGEHYLIASSLWPELSAETTLRPYRLVLTINRQGTSFLWPLRIPR